MEVTPWDVKGEIDYKKLIEEFGTEALNDEILERIEKHAGELHLFLKRKLFFSHRDLKWLFDEYEKGNKFYLYTGRGPSGKTHIGHLITWIFTKWMQDKFDAELWFQMTDDEKFLFKKLELEETINYAHDNALDVIAVGFDPKKTKIFLDTEYSKTLYPQALKVAKKITFSTAKAVFGFTNENNIGQIFFTSMQSVPAFLPSVLKGKNIPCLIPYAIDQDPHFRVCRDVLPKLGYYKPAAIHSIFLPGLSKGGKMSASDPYSAIFTTDDKATVKKKVGRAFTGGKESIEEQKKCGGNPEVCSVFKYLYMLFEDDDNLLKEREEKCKSGGILCGECKQYLTEKINKFLEEHQKKREEAKKVVEKFMVRD
ncbi:MAG: tryptophan--tRNA ligase [Candidatus Woesearchaeota archaeon]